jgi:hypothetical protein
MFRLDMSKRLDIDAVRAAAWRPAWSYFASGDTNVLVRPKTGEPKDRG